MSYHHCRNGHHAPECTGYIGPLDDYICLCSCHGEWNEKGKRVPRVAPAQSGDVLDDLWWKA
jgi:hypothetical protein